MRLPDKNGLTSEEVASRIADGLVNVNPDKKGRTIPGIILKNLLTFFNILNVVFFVLIISVGSYKNGLFIWVIVINTVIGIIQEIRTKKMLDQLTLLSAAKTRVVRDGQEQEIDIKDIVMDDVILLRSGDQIPADSIVMDGELEVNESLLTGEADDISKKPGAMLLSGSFATGGSAYVKVIHVGKDNYIESISGEAKKFKKVNSELRNSINRILKVISFIIIPLTVGFFCKLYFLQHETFKSAIEQVVSSGIGMIPEGLYLLTTLALTLGVMRLAKKKTLVQELYSIESLARVDVLCLDKTGTLTEGRMELEESVSLDESYPHEMEAAFTNLLRNQSSLNATGQAISSYFGESSEKWTLKHSIPFSSERKYSGASFEGHGTYYMGAQQFLCPENEALSAIVNEQAKKGLRVIVLVHSPEEREDNALGRNRRAIGYVLLSDVIRKDCGDTLKFFRDNGVTLKCISGDDPVTVSQIAASCGFENADKYVDVSKLSREELREAMRTCSVFGRVKPEEKKFMVECLQADGHTVGMTGDGVNDVLAMKQADCSIAMASGSDAARQTAHVVLLESDFTAMPDIFREGRRVINNIGHSAAMYLLKTTFSVLLTFFTILLGQFYPFEAVQLSIISGCAVGIPTFFLQLEPSFQPIERRFMRSIFRNAVPAGVTVFIVTFLVTNLGLWISGMNDRYMLQTISVLTTGWVYFHMLKRIYSPMTNYRRFVVYTMELVYLLVMIFGDRLEKWLHFELFNFTEVSVPGVLVLIGCITVMPILIDVFSTLFDKACGFMDRRAEHKKKKEKDKVFAKAA